MDIPDDSLDALHNLLSFHSSSDPAGLTIVDHVERRQCTLHTHDPTDPSEAPVDEFYYPVDRGVAISTERISLPHKAVVYVRNHAGILVNELTENAANQFPEDLYSVELTAPIKLYLVFECPFSVSVTSEEVTLDFGDPVEVLVGARSHHESPAGTITTTDDPMDVMTAVSYFASAMKTTTAERSYPTLRGHPPTIELGDELFVPPKFDKPDSDVRLVLPPDLRSIYTAATLAYYLCAKVEAGESPKVETSSGFSHALDDSPRGFEGEVERVLKQTFFLDCIVRTEGYYPVNLHEREQVEEEIDADFGELYNTPLETRLQNYLEVPYSVIEPHLPEWKLTAHMTLRPEHVEILPFLVNDLAVIRCTSDDSITRATDKVASPEGSLRRANFVRSALRSENESAPSPSLIELDDEDSFEQAWIGEGAPLGASKAMVEAYRNKLDREPTTGDIDITVVCNDLEMEAERDIADEVYGSRDELPFNVTIHRELTSSELQDALEESSDFFHYIGHIDAGGFECVDGRFDAAKLEYTGADAFFLNACTSYQQGKHLIEAGSIAGAVTLHDVINSGAERVGNTLVRLLNQGFPLRAALDLAKTQSIMGGHYVILGDGNFDITQLETGVPMLIDLKNENLTQDTYDLDMVSYPTKKREIGSMTIPYIGDNDKYFLIPGILSHFQVTKEEFETFLKKGNSPLMRNSKIIWKNELQHL